MMRFMRSKKNQKTNPIIEEIKNNNDIIIIDVRTISEFNEYHLIGSVNMPLGVLSKLIEKSIPDRDKHVYLYDNSGARSSVALKKVRRLGYKNARDIGGLEDIPPSMITKKP